MKYNDARANRSRNALINAGIQLLIKNPGASLKEVAEFAGVGRATLYRHFETREQLIQEIAIECLDETNKVMAPVLINQTSAKDTLSDMFRVLMPMADRYHFLLSLWSIAQGDEQVDAIYQQQLLSLYQLIEAGKAEASIRQDLSTDWILVTIDTMIYGGWWLISEGKSSPEEAAENALITLFNGVGSA